MTGPEDPAPVSDDEGRSVYNTWFHHVRVASTENIADLATVKPGTGMDGVGLALGDTVLLKDQTDLTQNGLYVVDRDGLVRDPTADSEQRFPAGSIVRASDGRTQGGALWINVSSNTYDMGRDSLIISPLEAAGGKPLPHADTHHGGGSDPLEALDIGALPLEVLGMAGGAAQLDSYSQLKASQVRLRATYALCTDQITFAADTWTEVPWAKVLTNADDINANGTRFLVRRTGIYEVILNFNFGGTAGKSMWAMVWDYQETHGIAETRQMVVDGDNPTSLNLTCAAQFKQNTDIIIKVYPVGTTARLNPNDPPRVCIRRVSDWTGVG